jgi:hypothetical protein
VTEERRRGSSTGAENDPVYFSHARRVEEQAAALFSVATVKAGPAVGI